MQDKKIKPPTMLEIKGCKDANKLREWRAFLFDNVNELITKNIIEWTIWEEMICRIDGKLENMPIFINVTVDGKTKKV
jgi:hypothetical protein